MTERSGPETLSQELSQVLEGRETDYFCTVEDDLAVAAWSFEEIRRSILASPESRGKASLGVYVSADLPSGAYGELSEDVMIVNTDNFYENAVQAYKRAEEYNLEDLEINQAQRF